MRTCLILLSCGMASLAQATMSWTFTSGTEGWMVADLHTAGPYYPPMATYSVSHNASGGCEGGYISRVDPSSNSYAFSLPVDQLPDGQDWVGGRLDFCLRSTHSNWTSEAFVIVVGGDGTVLRAPIALPSPVWSSYEVDLVPGSFITMAGAQPGAAQFQTVLNQVEAWYIMAEYGAQVQETSALDEVHLHTACPGDLVAPALEIQVSGTQESPQLNLQWAEVPGARHYAVHQLVDGMWVPLATSTHTSTTVFPAWDSVGQIQVRAICD
jgi:hypothetical protein